VRPRWLYARAGLIALVALIVLVAIPKLSTPRALAIWVVLATALVLFTLIQHRRGSSWSPAASRFEATLRSKKPRPPEPVELLRMERELVLGSADADHAHRRLLPLLRGAAAARISARHGFELGRRPEAARALLGEDVWELLRPDRPPPEDRHGPGVPPAQVAAVIERIESL
jgi:hypothetical protein